MPQPQEQGKFGSRLANRLIGLVSGTTPSSTLDSSPRAFRLVLTVALAAIGLSGWIVYSSIQSINPRAKNATNTNQSVAAELAKLKQKDTDQDGLSDYDELYAYHTSPYLKDSDSDGANDADELEKSNDPNCPEGKSCSAFAVNPSPVDARGQVNPDFLRQALRSAGVPQSTLENTDDAALLAIYQQVVANQPAGTNTNAATNSATNTDLTNAEPSSANTSAETLDSLRKLTPAEIRQMLTESGLEESTLGAVDDKTLKSIFDQAINEATVPTQ